MSGIKTNKTVRAQTGDTNNTFLQTVKYRRINNKRFNCLNLLSLRSQILSQDFIEPTQNHESTPRESTLTGSGKMLASELCNYVYLTIQYRFKKNIANLLLVIIHFNNMHSVSPLLFLLSAFKLAWYCRKAWCCRCYWRRDGKQEVVGVTTAEGSFGVWSRVVCAEQDNISLKGHIVLYSSTYRK